MFQTFLQTLIGPKLRAARDAILSGSGSAMIEAVATLADAVGSTEAAANLRAEAEGLSEGDKTKMARAALKLQAGAINYLLGLDGDNAIVVKALPPGGFVTNPNGDDLATEFGDLVAKCEAPPAMMAAGADTTGRLTPEQKDRLAKFAAAFLAALLKSFAGG